MSATRRHTLGLSLCIAILGVTPVMADLSSALDACLDHGLDIPARAENLSANGWNTDPDTRKVAEARAHALILTRMSGFNDAAWATLFQQAQAMTNAGTSSSDGRVFLTQDTDTLTLEKNSTGLQTCLYVGQSQDLSPIQAVLDGKAVSKAGVIMRLRGEAFRAIVTAHSLAPETAKTGFPEPLAYTTTFSVILDRSEGS